MEKGKDFTIEEKQIPVPKKRRKYVKSKVIEVKSATENNLKNISVKFPLGVFTCVTGVSGSDRTNSRFDGVILIIYGRFLVKNTVHPLKLIQ